MTIGKEHIKDRKRNLFDCRSNNKEINIWIRTVIINQLRKGEHNVLLSHELTMNELNFYFRFYIKIGEN